MEAADLTAQEHETHRDPSGDDGTVFKSADGDNDDRARAWVNGGINLPKNTSVTSVMPGNDEVLEVVASDAETMDSDTDEIEDITIIELSDTDIKEEPDDDYEVQEEEEEVNSVNPNDLGIIITQSELPDELIGNPVDGVYRCKFCPQKYPVKRNLIKHIERHINRGAIRKCRFCDFFTAVTLKLQEHECKHTKEKPYQCDICSYRCRLKGDLARHQDTHSLHKKYLCKVCGHRCRSAGNMKKHMETHRPDMPRNFPCMICGFAFKRASALKMHMNRRHNDSKPFSCNQCSFRCKTLWELKSHQVKHTDEHPFACTWPECGKTFKTKSDCNKHIKRHNGVKDYVCTLCGKRFASSTMLRTHITIHSDVRNFQCKQCQKTFKTRTALSAHYRTHLAVKPYRCDVCYKTYTNQSNLDAHKRVHDEGRPYQCPICVHGSREMDHLMAHVGSEHLHSFLYLCCLCRKPFGKSFQLQLHLQRCHKEDMQGRDEMLVYEPKYLGIDLQPESTGLFDAITFARYFASENQNAMWADTATTVKQEPGVNGSGDNSETGNNTTTPPTLHLPPVVQLARYGGIPFCLARKNSGVQLNCQKSGKKPKRWFMDVSLMTEADAEKHNQYLMKKELGLLPQRRKTQSKKGMERKRSGSGKAKRNHKRRKPAWSDEEDTDEEEAYLLAQKVVKKLEGNGPGQSALLKQYRVSSRPKKPAVHFKNLPVGSFDGKQKKAPAKSGSAVDPQPSVSHYAGSKTANRRQTKTVTKKQQQKKLHSKPAKGSTKKGASSTISTGKHIPGSSFTQRNNKKEKPGQADNLWALALAGPLPVSHYNVDEAAVNSRCWVSALRSSVSRGNFVIRRKSVSCSEQEGTGSEQLRTEFFASCLQLQKRVSEDDKTNNSSQSSADVAAQSPLFSAGDLPQTSAEKDSGVLMLEDCQAQMADINPGVGGRTIHVDVSDKLSSLEGQNDSEGSIQKSTSECELSFGENVLRVQEQGILDSGVFSVDVQLDSDKNLSQQFVSSQKEGPAVSAWEEKGQTSTSNQQQTSSSVSERDDRNIGSEAGMGTESQSEHGINLKITGVEEQQFDEGISEEKLNSPELATEEVGSLSENCRTAISVKVNNIQGENYLATVHSEKPTVQEDCSGLEVQSEITGRQEDSQNKALEGDVSVANCSDVTANTACPLVIEETNHDCPTEEFQINLSEKMKRNDSQELSSCENADSSEKGSTTLQNASQVQNELTTAFDGIIMENKFDHRPNAKCEMRNSLQLTKCLHVLVSDLCQHPLVLDDLHSYGVHKVCLTVNPFSNKIAQVTKINKKQGSQKKAKQTLSKAAGFLGNKKLKVMQTSKLKQSKSKPLEVQNKTVSKVGNRAEKSDRKSKGATGIGALLLATAVAKQKKSAVINKSVKSPAKSVSSKVKVTPTKAMSVKGIKSSMKSSRKTLDSKGKKTVAQSADKLKHAEGGKLSKLKTVEQSAAKLKHAEGCKLSKLKTVTVKRRKTYGKNKNLKEKAVDELTEQQESFIQAEYNNDESTEGRPTCSIPLNNVTVKIKLERIEDCEAAVAMASPELRNEAVGFSTSEASLPMSQRRSGRQCKLRSPVTPPTSPDANITHHGKKPGIMPAHHNTCANKKSSKVKTLAGRNVTERHSAQEVPMQASSTEEAIVNSQVMEEKTAEDKGHDAQVSRDIGVSPDHSKNFQQDDSIGTNQFSEPSSVVSEEHSDQNVDRMLMCSASQKTPGQGDKSDRLSSVVGLRKALSGTQERTRNHNDVITLPLHGERADLNLVTVMPREEVSESMEPKIKKMNKTKIHPVQESDPVVQLSLEETGSQAPVMATVKPRKVGRPPKNAKRHQRESAANSEAHNTPDLPLSKKVRKQRNERTLSKTVKQLQKNETFSRREEKTGRRGHDKLWAKIQQSRTGYSRAKAKSTVQQKLQAVTTKSCAFSITRPSKLKKGKQFEDAPKVLPRKKKKYMYVETDEGESPNPPAKRRGRPPGPKVVLDTSQANLCFEPLQQPAFDPVNASVEQKTTSSLALIGMSENAPSFVENASSVLVVETSENQSEVFVPSSQSVNHGLSPWRAQSVPASGAIALPQSYNECPVQDTDQGQQVEPTSSQTMDPDINEVKPFFGELSESVLPDIRPLLDDLNLMNHSVTSPRTEINVHQTADSSVFDQSLSQLAEGTSSYRTDHEARAALLKVLTQHMEPFKENAFENPECSSQTSGGSAVSKTGRPFCNKSPRGRKKKEKDELFRVQYRYRQVHNESDDCDIRRSFRPKKLRLSEEQMRQAQGADSDTDGEDRVVSALADDIESDIEFLSADYSSVDLTSQRLSLEDLRVDTFSFGDLGEDSEQLGVADMGGIGLHQEQRAQVQMTSLTENCSDLDMSISGRNPENLNLTESQSSSVGYVGMKDSLDGRQMNSHPLKLETGVHLSDLGVVTESSSGPQPLVCIKSDMQDLTPPFHASASGLECKTETAEGLSSEKLCNCFEHGNSGNMASNVYLGPGDFPAIKKEWVKTEPVFTADAANASLETPPQTFPHSSLSSRDTLVSVDQLTNLQPAGHFTQQPRVPIVQNQLEHHATNNVQVPIELASATHHPSLTIFVKTRDGQSVLLEDGMQTAPKAKDDFTPT